MGTDPISPNLAGGRLYLIAAGTQPHSSTSVSRMDLGCGFQSGMRLCSLTLRPKRDFHRPKSQARRREPSPCAPTHSEARKMCHRPASGLLPFSQIFPFNSAGTLIPKQRETPLDPSEYGRVLSTVVPLTISTMCRMYCMLCNMSVASCSRVFVVFR